MPINRPDGRHWCAPEQEEPDADGQWTCPDCETVWAVQTSEGPGWVWAPANSPATSEQPLSEQED